MKKEVKHVLQLPEGGDLNVQIFWFKIQFLKYKKLSFEHKSRQF